MNDRNYVVGALLAVALIATCSKGDMVVETFELFGDSALFSNNSPPPQFSLTKTGLMIGGVSFDAKLTVTPSPGHDLYSYTFGLGVDGVDNLNLINNGEYLDFSIEILNEIGGSVSFDGFTGIDYTVLHTPPIGVTLFGGDSLAGSTQQHQVTLTSQLQSEDISAWMPLELRSMADLGAPNANPHLISGITGSFSLAAVPEPSGFLFGGLVTALASAAGRRRRRV